MNHSGIIDNIRNFFNSASHKLTPIGILQKITLYSDFFSNVNIYYLKRELPFSGRNQTAFLLPLSKDINPTDIIEKIKTEWPIINECKIIFINCFDIGEEKYPENINIVSIEELWDKIIGINEIIRKQNKDASFEMIANRYINRNIDYIDFNLDKNKFVSFPRGLALDYLLKWARNEAKELHDILIIGERGEGKSWLLKRFVYEQNKNIMDKPWLIPPAIYIDLKKYSKHIFRKKGIEKSLAYYIYSNIDSASIGEIYFCDSLLHSGNIILVLDSFDEMITEATYHDLTRQLQYLSDYLPENSKTVLATRGTRFSSLIDVYNHFVEDEAIYKEINNDEISSKSEKYLPSGLSRPQIHRYDIFRLCPFSTNDFVALAEKENVSKKVELIVREKLKKDFMSEQCCILAEIPACAKKILDLINDGIEDPLRLFELSLINQFIEKNIEDGKTLNEISYIYRNGKGNLIRISENIDLSKRIDILQHIGWYLLEADSTDFDSTLISNTFLDFPSTKFEAVINDLRTQTVFNFCEDKIHLKFLRPTIQAYFTARYIYSSLANGKIKEGIKYFGRHNLNKDWKISFLIKNYLKSFCENSNGIIDCSNYYNLIYRKSEDYTIINFSNLNRAINELIKKQPPYSNWTRYLTGNLKTIIPKDELSIPNIDWDSISEESKNQFQWATFEGDLIFGDANIQPFCISRHEATNKEFHEFLNSKWIPVLKPTMRGILEVTFEEKKNRNHPLKWEAIHLDLYECDIRLRYFTNDYHLFDWQNGIIPEKKQNHPVCWLSGFVIAIYCNWKTWTLLEKMRKPLSQNKLYYQILLRDGKFPELIQPSLFNNDSDETLYSAYRMLTPDEWNFAARGDDLKNKYPWDSLLNSDDPDFKRKGKRLKESLLNAGQESHSVFKTFPNTFGIYGMIGNVREWAFKEIDPSHDTKIQEGYIMGATAALSEKNFQYDAPNKQLPLFNTNLDVGFRWGRSLPKKIFNK